MPKKHWFNSTQSIVIAGVFLAVVVLGFAYVLITKGSNDIMPAAYGQGISWRVEYNEQGQIARSIDPAGRATHTPTHHHPTAHYAL